MAAHHDSFKSSRPKPRFSRKSLNIIILAVSALILVLMQTGSFESFKASREGKEASVTQQVIDLESIELTEYKTQIDVEQWQHSKGAQVYFVQADEIPMVDIRLIFNAGGARDGARPGLAKLTAALLGEGTQQHSVDEIALHFEKLGSSFSAVSHRDMGILHLRSLVSDRYLAPSLDMFVEILSSSTFPETSLERIRELMLLGVEQEQQNPQALLDRMMWETLYQGHPYGVYPKGTRESLTKMKRKDVQEFYRKYYVAANVTVAIVGQFERRQAESVVEALLKALPRGEVAPALPEPELKIPAEPVHITFPSQQTHIRIATLGITRDDVIYVPLYVGNQILGGGGFTSLLNKAIRQDEGLAYSVYSHFSAMQARGPIIIDLQTKNEEAARALGIAQTLLKDFVETGPMQTDLTATQKHIVANFPLRLSSNGQKLGYLGSLGFYDLPTEFLNTFVPAVKALSVEQVHQAVQATLGSYPHLMITLGPEDPFKNKSNEK